MRAFVVVFALISAASAFTLQHIDEQKGEFVGDAASSLIGQETNGAIQAEPKAFEGGAGDYSSGNDYSDNDYNSGRDEGFGGPSSYESFDDIGGGEGQGPFGRDSGRGGPSQDSRRPRQGDDGAADYNEGYDYYGDGQRDQEGGQGGGAGGDYDYSYGDDDDSADYKPSAYDDDDDYTDNEGRSNNSNYPNEQQGEQGYPNYQQQEGDHNYPSADAAAAAYYGRNQDEEQGAQQSEEEGDSQKKDGYSESDFSFNNYDF